MKCSIKTILFAILFVISVLSKPIDAEKESSSESSSEEDESSVVETESGRVRGRKNYTLYESKAFYAFKGIPYARAPVEELRFKPPRKPVPWLDIYNAFEFGNECIQSQLFTNLIVGSENCLFLNVYVPIEAFSPTQSSNKLAVMLYIHGGGYTTGSGNYYGPDFLLEQNVILVTFNYRLGPFGFLTLNTPDYSGNMGLKDQLLALKWVNKNIERFGGDKTKITIFGHSAGSTSVNFHVISAASRGLFQRAIMSSGTVLNPWSYTDQNHISVLYNLAANVYNPVDNNRDLIEMLKQIDATILIQRTKQDLYVSGLGRKVVDFLWSPVIEHHHTVDPFLSAAPLDRLTDSRYKSTVDTMFGYTAMEMYIIMRKDLLNPSALKTFDQQFEIQFPLKNAQLKFHTKEYKEVAMKIRKHYFDERPIGNSTLFELSELMADIWMTYGIELCAQLQANKSTGNTFFYNFSVTGELNLLRRLSSAGARGLNGSTHGDDIFYLFRMNGLMLPDKMYDLEADSLERKTIGIMTKLWTNFAKFGNPLPENDERLTNTSTALGRTRFNYIDITNEGLVIRINPNDANYMFWNDIFDEYKKHWTPKIFTYNSMAVKVPLAILCALLLLIGFCKLIGLCSRQHKRRKSMAP